MVITIATSIDKTSHATILLCNDVPNLFDAPLPYRPSPSSNGTGPGAMRTRRFRPHLLDAADPERRSRR